MRMEIKRICADVCCAGIELAEIRRTLYTFLNSEIPKVVCPCYRETPMFPHGREIVLRERLRLNVSIERKCNYLLSCR